MYSRISQGIRRTTNELHQADTSSSQISAFPITNVNNSPEVFFPRNVEAPTDNVSALKKRSNSRGFQSEMHNKSFGKLDALITFPDEFIPKQDGSVKIAGSVNRITTSEGQAETHIKFTWIRKITPHFKAQEQSEIVEDGQESSSSFDKDIGRAQYTIRYLNQDSGIPFSKGNIDELLTIENKKVISTIAHQGHLADVTDMLYGISRVKEDHLFTQDPDKNVEHEIHAHEEVWSITSKSHFQLRSHEDENYVKGFNATIEQTTFLDSNTFDNNGHRILTIQPDSKHSVQKIELNLIAPTLPEKGEFTSRLRSVLAYFGR